MSKAGAYRGVGGQTLGHARSQRVGLGSHGGRTAL